MERSAGYGTQGARRKAGAATLPIRSAPVGTRREAPQNRMVLPEPPEVRCQGTRRTAPLSALSAK